MPSLIRIAVELVAGAAIALLLRRFVCMPVYIKGRSMRDTLRGGEIVFALRRTISRPLKRFDVVLCHYPTGKGLRIKRIAGMPGETVELREGELVIDGELVPQDFALRQSRGSMEERRLGADEYFLLGDNRLGSRDSRSVGAIADERIIAVVKFVLLPPRRL